VNDESLALSPLLLLLAAVTCSVRFKRRASQCPKPTAESRTASAGCRAPTSGAEDSNSVTRGVPSTFRLTRNGHAGRDHSCTAPQRSAVVCGTSSAAGASITGTLRESLATPRVDWAKVVVLTRTRPIAGLTSVSFLGDHLKIVIIAGPNGSGKTTSPSRFCDSPRRLTLSMWTYRT